MPGAVVLTTYSRPELLERCLLSLNAARRSGNFQVVVVLQPGSSQVGDVVERLVPASAIVARSPARGGPAIQVIRRQVLVGLSIAFSNPSVDWVLKLEEDSQIAHDALAFVEFVHDRYKRRAAYRGVNLGSLEFGPGLGDSFTLLRYGLHGFGGVVTRRVWRTIQASSVRVRPNDGFDGLVEPILKTGFMVTPNLSRVMNHGWIGGTHVETATSPPEFFAALNKSFQLAESYQPGAYSRMDIPHSWREDAVLYRVLDTPEYLLRLSRHWLRRN